MIIDKLLKRIILVCSCLSFLTYTPLQARILKTTLKNCIFTKKLTVNASPLVGGDYVLGLKFDLKNTTTDTLMVTIDPALIFVPEDTNYQNLVTWGSEILVVNASDSASIKLDAFCGKSYARCPKLNLKYNYWKQGDSNMIKTLKYAKENKMGIDLTQKSVWTYTNNHPLNSVYNYAQPKESEQLVKYIAGLRKMKVPDQFLDIKRHNDPGKPVLYHSDVKKLYIPIKWSDNPNIRHMFVTVFKENGDVYKRIVNSEQIVKNEHTVWVEFNTVNDNPGTYYIELKDNNNKVWDKKKVVISYNITELL